MKNKGIIAFSLLAMSLSACTSQTDPKSSDFSPKIVKTEAEWKEVLTADEYQVLRNKGTERPFTGTLLENKKEGTYLCKACSEPLFKSGSKFNSGTGWPSFYQAIPGKVVELEDGSLGHLRTEILCNNCGGHLGHVFPDGPQPTGLRYCVNSISLSFEEKMK